MFFNIFEEPYFTAPFEQDFSLLENSPCIDAGDPSFPNDPDMTICDMGAIFFEQMPAPAISVSEDTLTFPDTYIDSTSVLSLTIYNTGTLDLIIDSMVVSQTPEVFVIDWNPANNTIIPGESLEISVSFTPVEFMLYFSNLVVYNNDETTEIILVGQAQTLSVGKQNPGSNPENFVLYPAYPNPFNPETKLSYNLPEDGYMTLQIFDIQGNETAYLINGWQNSGYHELIFDAANLPAGIYFARLTSGTFNQTQKLLLIK